MLYVEDIEVKMNDGLDLFTASYYAEVYKRKNPKATFKVINSENGDVEYII